MRSVSDITDSGFWLYTLRMTDESEFGIGGETSFALSGASQPILTGSRLFHSESDRDAFDHVKIIDGIRTSQQLSEWQHVSVCKLHNLVSCHT